MSPEQAKRRRIELDHRTDIYSLGATLYEALTGQPPFRGRDHADTLSQIIERDPRPPRQLNPRVPQDLETIVLKCLRKDLDDRYGTAEALGQDLKRFVRGDAIEARLQPGWEKAMRQVRRRWRLAVAAIAMLTVVSAALAVAAVVIARARDESRYDLYVANMRLALEDWRAGNMAGFLDVLERHVPQAGEPDLRGWEWYHLNDLSGEELFSASVTTRNLVSVAWSPDGRYLAAGGDDRIVNVWELSAEGDDLLEIQRLPLDTEVTHVAWSPDGERLAVALKFDASLVWDVFTGEDYKTFSLPGADGQLRPRSVAWRPDGKRLAVGHRTRTEVHIWNVETGTLERSLPSDSGKNRSVAWSPDAHYFTTASGTVWETANWTVVHKADSAVRTAWSTDGAYLAAIGWSGWASICHVGTWETLRRWNAVLGIGGDVAWSPDGTRLATGGEDLTVKIWARATGDQLLTFRGHTDSVREVAWHPQRELLASVGNEGTVKLWATDTREGSPLPGDSEVEWMAGGRWLATRDPQRRGDVTVLDPATGEVIRRFVVTEEAEVVLFAFSPDDQTLATATDEGVVNLWSWEQPGEEPVNLRPHDGRQNFDPTMALSWSSAGKLFATGGADRKAIVWSRRGEKVLTVPAEMTVNAVAWSPDGDSLAIPVYRGSWGIEIWHVPSRRRTRLHEASGPLRGSALAWSPTGDRIAAGGGKRGGFVIFDTMTGEELVLRRGHTSRVESIAWSPDGRRLATTSRDRTTRIWDAERSGDELLTLRGRLFLSLAWHPDGERLAAAGWGQLKIWDAPGYADARESTERAE